MGVDLDKGPITNLDNKLADNELPDTNKMSESIAEKTAKLHRLLGDCDKEKGFHLDLESPESEKLTDSVSEKEEKDVDDFEDEKDNMSLNYPSPRGIHHTAVNNDIYALPVKRRQKRREELPLGWEKHEVNTLIYFNIHKNLLAQLLKGQLLLISHLHIYYLKFVQSICFA